jgi:hypothetical protein
MDDKLHQEQNAAIANLTKALDRCAKAGLMGGVYDRNFCVWPVGTYHPLEMKEFDFFEAVAHLGGDSIVTEMMLDGGAGV